MYSFIFRGTYQDIFIAVKGSTTIGELISLYFNRIQKSNLLINNIDNTYFIYNSHTIEKRNYTQRVCNFFYIREGNMIVAVNSYNKIYNFKIIRTIKDNVYTSVYEAKIDSFKENVAVKKIFKDKIKEEMIFTKCKERITEEDFKPEIEKFNKELKNMEKCYCENSVKIYDYYDTEKEFIIIMELCDETLFHLLARTQNGFNVHQIKFILSQLNNVFKRMNYYGISHRDIKF